MRLLTRSDFDGLACAMLLKQAGIIDSWKFTHPKDLQDGKIEVTDNDILANVPYVPGCGMWFDHHASEALRMMPKNFKGAFADAPSAARVIWDYYSKEIEFPPHFATMLDAVDKVDGANLTKEEILNPTGWVLLGYIMDPRTGLGRFREFRVSNYALMEMLIDACRELTTVEEVLNLPDVAERVKLYFEQDELFTQMMQDRTRMHGKCAVIDLRDQDPIYTGNRFRVYAMFPECNVSLHILWGFQRQNVVLTVGKSIVDRSNKVNVGELMLKYGGGGHVGVGTCQVAETEVEQAAQEIIAALNN